MAASALRPTTRRQIAHDGVPRVAAVGRAIDLAAGRAEIDAARVERIDGHRVAQHVHVAILLRQAFGERFPFVAARLAAIHAQLAVRRKMLGIALDGHDVDGFRFVRVNVNRETEVGRQIAADLAPLTRRRCRCATRPSAFA